MAQPFTAYTTYATSLQRNIDGQVAEAKALRLVAESSREQARGQKIFHGVHVKDLKLAALAKIFDSPEPKYEDDLVESFKKGVIQLEMDTVIIDKNFIGLMEVKDNDTISHGTMAVKQLHLREKIFLKIFDIISANPKPPIKKFVYFGGRDKEKPTFKTDNSEIKILRDYKDKDQTTFQERVLSLPRDGRWRDLHRDQESTCCCIDFSSICKSLLSGYILSKMT